MVLLEALNAACRGAMLHIDIPTPEEFRSLAAIKRDVCVSLYVPTEPLRAREHQNRLAVENLAADALRQLNEAKMEKRTVEALEKQLRHLTRPGDGDPADGGKIRKLQNKRPDPLEEFWRFQGHGLVVLATPRTMNLYRMPYRPRPLAEVSDRFHLAPLLRVLTSPHEIYVLALSEKNVRLVRAFVNLPPMRVQIPELPHDAEQVARRASIRERNEKGRLRGSEGIKVLLQKFVRRVDGALQPVLAGRSAPLVLAADEPLASMFRSISKYPGLMQDIIPGNPNQKSDAQLEDAALPLLDRRYRSELDSVIARYNELKPRRATTDVSYSAHAATAGAIEQLLVDLDARVPGVVSDTDGSVTYASSDDAEVYSVVDEIARRALATGAHVLGARREELPESAPVVAILRYEFG
jgi:hypothetical protein